MFAIWLLLTISNSFRSLSDTVVGAVALAVVILGSCQRSIVAQMPDRALIPIDLSPGERNRPPLRDYA